MDQQFVGVFTIGQTLDRGIRLYKMALSKMLLLFIVPGIFVGFSYVKQMALGSTMNPGALGITLVFLAISMILMTWTYVVATRYLYELSLGKTPTAAHMLRMATPRDLLLIFTYVILMVIFLLSFIALVIPGIFLMNLIYIAFIVAILERRFFFGWLKRTLFLTKKRWWKTAGINAITFIIMAVPFTIALVMMMSSMFASIASGAAATTPGQIPVTPISVAGAILYTLTIVLLTPLLQAINIVHYNSLRAEKENIDLSSRLDAIPTPPHV
jgi:hypothetical protein